MSKFHFKHFSIDQTNSSLKVGTDAMLLGSFILSNTALTGLDIGAGTGVLSLMVAQNHPNITIDSIEIDSKSFIDLNANIECSSFKDRIHAINQDFFSYNFTKKYDLIFSNPPYYDNGFLPKEKNHLIAKHTLHFSKSIFFSKIKDLLTVIGNCWIIIPFDNINDWILEANNNGLNIINQINISGKEGDCNRVICVFGFTNFQNNYIKQFTVRDKNGFYTTEYHQLTQNFHNKKPLK
jgi:tRNA1Val (adenine37-N6)-methyltransferase